jgi:tetratricopeptide (TPR) repeat protein
MAGTFARHGRSWDVARGYQLESLSIFRSLGDLDSTVSVLGGLSNIAAELGDYPEAERWLEEAMTVAQGSGTERFIAMCTGNLADLAVRQGHHERALELAATAVDLYRSLAWGPGLAWCLYLHALCHLRMGQESESAKSTKEALPLARASGDAETLTWLFVLTGATAARQGQTESGAVLIGLSDALSEQLDLSLTGAEAELLREATTALRQALGDGPFETAESRGRAMSTEDGVALALASLD